MLLKTYLSKKVMVTTNRLYLFSVRRKDISPKGNKAYTYKYILKPSA